MEEPLPFPEDDWVNNLQLLDLQLLDPADFLIDHSDGEDPSSQSSNPPTPTLSPLLPSLLQSSSPIQSPSSSSSSAPSPITVIEQSKQHPAPGPYRNRLSLPAQDTQKKDTSSVLLTRDQVLSSTSEEFEEFIENITKTRPLSGPERKEVNRQRRLIKNRESAQLSRKRKKNLIDTLEGEVRELQKVHDTFDSQLEELEADNTILKAEVTQLFSVIRDSPVLSKMLLGVASWMVLYSITQSMKTNQPESVQLSPIIKQLQQIEVPVTC